MTTINVLDGATARAYATWELDDPHSRLWEDHYVAQAVRAQEGAQR